MRLHDARTIKLLTFQSENEVTRYSVLSHVWCIEEVVFADLDGSGATQRQSYGKIKDAC
jgi:hypothetical protein